LIAHLFEAQKFGAKKRCQRFYRISLFGLLANDLYHWLAMPLAKRIAREMHRCCEQMLPLHFLLPFKTDLVSCHFLFAIPMVSVSNLGFLVAPGLSKK